MRPKIFIERESINVYLHPNQKYIITSTARSLGISPSNLIRIIADKIGNRELEITL